MLCMLYAMVVASITVYRFIHIYAYNTLLIQLKPETPKGCVVIEDTREQPNNGGLHGKKIRSNNNNQKYANFSFLQRKFFKSICVLLCYMIHIITHTNTFLNRFMLHHIYILYIHIQSGSTSVCLYYVDSIGT